MSMSTTAFGTVFAPTMSLATFEDGEFSAVQVVPSDEIGLSPAAHVLHYASTCFEGLKAHKGDDGTLRIFRMHRHAQRMQRTAERLHFPVPTEDLFVELVTTIVKEHRDLAPDPPGSLYIRPTMIGTEPNIGAAASPSRTGMLYVLLSPVGDYFAGGLRPLSLLVETETPRTTPQFGMVKSGANYIMALGPTLEAKASYAVDQILFCLDHVVTETGAANFLLLDDERVITPVLTDAFLHGVTRESILVIARELGYAVEERTVTLDETLEWVGRDGAEAALSGTAAVLAPVGSLVHEGRRLTVGSGEAGPNVVRLRQALVDVHRGRADDRHGWTTPV